MKDERKTKEQLTDELVELRRRIGQFEELEAERNRAEEEVQRHLDRLVALREIDRAISSTLDLPEVLIVILEQLERIVPHHSAALYLLTDDTAKVTAASGVPDLERVMEVSFSVKEDALAQQLLEEKRPLVLADAQADERFQARGETEYVRSWIGVPLIVKGEAIGFLTIDHTEPGVYDEESAETAQAFASQAAIAIDDARAYEMLKSLNQQIMEALAMATETRDPYTTGHSLQVTHWAVAIAEKMGLSDQEVQALQLVGPLHDIGKIGVPDSVLNKPARLTSAEAILIQSHPVIAAHILGKIRAFADLIPVIKHHHEWYDGRGYPDGLKGEEIPLLARILAVADGFEAMTSERPYRLPKSREEAVEELKAGAGTQWDPEVVRVFLEVLEEEKSTVNKEPSL